MDCILWTEVWTAFYEQKYVGLSSPFEKIAEIMCWVVSFDMCSWMTWVWTVPWRIYLRRYWLRKWLGNWLVECVSRWCGSRQLIVMRGVGGKWAVLVELERLSYSIFYMQAGPCNPWGLDSSNHSWLEPRDASWDLYLELVLLLLVGAEEFVKIEVFHTSTAHCTLNGFYQWIYIIEFSIYISCTSCLHVLIYCTHIILVNYINGQMLWWLCQQQFSIVWLFTVD